MIRIGVDIGGTFTDFAVWRGGDEGYTSVASFKVPSTPPAFDEAVKVGVDRLLAEGTLRRDEPVLLVHGTTVGTNMVIERSGPKLALLTTAGFRDVLNLQRLRLENPLDLFSERPAPLIGRDLVYAIEERLEPDGSVRVPLDRAAVVAAARSAKAANVQGIVVCFLHSYQNAVHEFAARDAIRESGIDIDVVVSSEVFAQQGEYERAVVAILNAYVKPTMSAYIRELERFLAERLPKARLLITRSNGGVMSASESCAFPVHTLLSGPAAGVTAAQFLGELVDADKMLTMDMGGTSTDLSLVWSGRASVTTQAMVGDFPLMMPVTGIEAIGAGGGSIAEMNGGVLKVGPRSAGSRPGPACYGQGGTLPTVSDAYLLCGLLDPAMFLGGAMPLHRDRAEAAMAPLARALGRDVVSAAEACIAVATSNMTASVLPYLARVGVDPQDLTLLVYGGAGAIHGPLLAEEIGIQRLLVPRTPSVFCALGGVVSGLVHDVVRSVRGSLITIERLRSHYEELAAEARSWLDKQVPTEVLASSEVTLYAEMRFRGQFFTVDVPLSRAVLDGPDLAMAEAAFRTEHERIYRHDSDAPVDFVGLRVRVAGHLPRPGAVALPTATGPASDAIVGRRAIRLHGRAYPDTPVIGRAKLGPGHRFSGPAIVEQADATILIPPGFEASVGVFGDLVLTR